MEDAAGRRWRYRRIFFRVGLFALFWIIAFWLGPNWINFRQLTEPTPDYFIPIVLRDCVPTVRAMKEYQRDFGHLPNGPDDLKPYHLAETPQMIWSKSGSFGYLTAWNHVIEYDFTPGNEHWSVRGAFANGRIAVPPVTVGPSARATTRP